MTYTTKELSKILKVHQTMICLWITEGLVSPHSNKPGERIFLKAEEVPGPGRGGKYYLIKSKDVNKFMKKLYKTTYLYSWENR